MKYNGSYNPSYNSGNGYSMYNVVSYVESCFISTVNGNNNVPVSLVRDASGYLESYTLGTGWDFLLNELDSSIEMSKAIKACIMAKDEAEGVISGLQSVLQGLISHDTSTDASILMLANKDASIEGLIQEIPYNVEVLLPDPPEFPDED